MPAPLPDHDQDHGLARRILDQALDELRREAVRTGRLDLFEQLLPELLGRAGDNAVPSRAVAATLEHRLAMTRLRERLRERVNAQLREIEPDPVKRRALRHRLQAVRTAHEESP